MNNEKTNRELLMELPEPYATQAINNAMRVECDGEGGEWLDGTHRWERQMSGEDVANAILNNPGEPETLTVLKGCFTWTKCMEGPQYWTLFARREFSEYFKEYDK